MRHDGTSESSQSRPQRRQFPHASGNTPFLSAPYFAGEDGRYQPSKGINRCPAAVANEPCQVTRHSFRRRKTGPEIPLRILYCKRHDLHFTVYPVGYVPYGRRAEAVVDFCGRPLEWSEPEPDVSCRGVFFEAALDAANDRSWQQPVDGRRPSYPTQRRWIERSGQLLGLDPRLPNPVVEGIRDHLAVPGLDHHLTGQRFQQTNRLKARGQAIVEVQQLVARDSTRVLRLLAAGSLSGLWGYPFLWDAARGRRLSLLSRTARALRAPP